MVTAVLLATLLAGCGASQPVAGQDERQRVGEPTGGELDVPEEGCPQGAACTEDSAIERPEAADDGAPAPIIDPGPCRDDAACAAGFLVGKTFHALSCAPVRPELVTDEVVARGLWAGGIHEVRVIAGVDPAVLVAIDIPGGECADGDVALSSFSMVFVGRYDASKAQEAICAAAVDEHLERNDC